MHQDMPIFLRIKHLAGAMLLAAATMPQANALTIEDIKTDGAYTISSQSLPAAGFGGATVYSPNKPGKYPLVAVSPGFVAKRIKMAGLGRRLATHGYVVVVIDTRTLLDFPSSRGNQLLAALKAASLVTTGPAAGKIDVSRQVVAGHSMGGGGAMEAAAAASNIKAVVAYAPFNFWSTPYRRISAPTAIIGGSADLVAAAPFFARPFYNTIPNSTSKMLAVIKGANHFFPESDDPSLPPNEPTSYSQIAWLNFFVKQKSGYKQFLQGKDPAWLSVTGNRILN